MSPLLLATLLAAGASAVNQADRLAAEARSAAAAQPEAALAKARRALALTADFEPTLFVKAGRKGEVVEDSFQAAREAYRRHRAGVYHAVGDALAGAGQHVAAARYLGRAVALAPAPERVQALARAWLARGEGAVALALLHAHAGEGGLGPESRAIVEQAVDAIGAPSAQAEIDRSRLAALSVGPVEPLDGPFKAPPASRLSTGTALSFDDPAPTVLYVAERSCRTCSEDLLALKQAVAAGTRVVLVPEVGDDDHALRQVIRLYKHPWPVLLGRGVAAALGTKPRGVLLVGRRGWSGARIKPDAPLAAAVRAALTVFAREDIPETVPRAGWNGRPVARRGAPKPPPLLPEGLAPGEDEPAPDEFTRAVEAYRARRYAEALKLFDALAAKGDGWLLPPEARLDRALAMAGLGQREAARRLLLATGDSRFQDAVDRALETVGTPGQP